MTMGNRFQRELLTSRFNETIFSIVGCTQCQMHQSKTYLMQQHNQISFYLLLLGQREIARLKEQKATGARLVHPYIKGAHSLRPTVNHTPCSSQFSSPPTLSLQSPCTSQGVRIQQFPIL